MKVGEQFWAAVNAARECEAQTGIPWRFTVAQWAIESGWGKHQPGNNCFGIKARPGSTERQLLETTEFFTDEQLARFLALGDGRTAKPESERDERGRRRYRVKDWFATFPSIRECFQARAKLLLTGRYAEALKRHKAGGSAEQFIQEISVIYATAPNYAALVSEVIGAINRIVEMG